MSVKKIAIISNPEKDAGRIVGDRLLAVLADYDCEASVVQDASELQSQDNPDLLIVLGGDGSIMRAARYAAPACVPILGINLGRIGYMAELETNELEMIGGYFSGNYSIEERMMLRVSYEDKSTHYALNDAVVSNGAISKMVALELYCNGSFVSEYHADGLIFATPTGSTAYSMSAGGPIIDPSLSCILSTPVCSHSLTSRPIVFSSGSKLRIKNCSRGSVSVYATLDGGENRLVPRDESVFVEKADAVTRLVRIKNESFYNLLGKKVN